jgi:hypothetical protein
MAENKMRERKTLKATSELPSKCGLLYFRGLIIVEKSLSLFQLTHVSLDKESVISFLCLFYLSDECRPR